MTRQPVGVVFGVHSFGVHSLVSIEDEPILVE